MKERKIYQLDHCNDYTVSSVRTPLDVQFRRPIQVDLHAGALQKLFEAEHDGCCRQTWEGCVPVSEAHSSYIANNIPQAYGNCRARCQRNHLIKNKSQPSWLADFYSCLASILRPISNEHFALHNPYWTRLTNVAPLRRFNYVFSKEWRESWAKANTSP